MNSVALHDPHPKSQNYANNHTGIQPKIPDFPGVNFMPCNCGIGTLLVLYVAILAQYPLGQGTPRNLACGYMPRSPGKRVALCAAWPTLRVVGLCFGFYLLPNHTRY